MIAMTIINSINVNPASCLFMLSPRNHSELSTVAHDTTNVFPAVVVQGAAKKKPRTRRGFLDCPL